MSAHRRWKKRSGGRSSLASAAYRSSASAESKLVSTAAPRFCAIARSCSSLTNRRAQVRRKVPALVFIGFRKRALCQQPRKESLGEIFRVMRSAARATDEGANRKPIRLAQSGECRSRSGVILTRCATHHAPPSGLKGMRCVWRRHRGSELGSREHLHRVVPNRTGRASIFWEGCG